MIDLDIINFYFDVLRLTTTHLSMDHYIFKGSKFQDPDNINIMFGNAKFASHDVSNSFVLLQNQVVADAVVINKNNYYYFKNQNRSTLKLLENNDQVLEIFKAWHTKIKNLENFK